MSVGIPSPTSQQEILDPPLCNIVYSGGSKRIDSIPSPEFTEETSVLSRVYLI